jgi:hypothetical protein
MKREGSSLIQPMAAVIQLRRPDDSMDTEFVMRCLLLRITDGELTKALVLYSDSHYRLSPERKETKLQYDNDAHYRTIAYHPVASTSTNTQETIQ